MRMYGSHLAHRFARHAVFRPYKPNPNIMIKPLKALGQAALTTSAKKLFLISLLTGLAATASARDVYTTSFEKSSFTADQPLVGQDGWIAPPPLSPGAAIITSSKPRQGRQTLQILGSDLEPQDFIAELTEGYYNSIGSYRKTVNYDTNGSQTIILSAHVRVDGPLTDTNFFSTSISAIGLDDEGNASGVGELAISSDGHVYGYSSQDLVPTMLTSAPVTLGEWHNLAIHVDFAARTYSFFVDGEPLGTFDFDPSATSDVFLRGSIIAYAAPDTATEKAADYAAYVDKFSIRAVGPKAKK